MIFALSFMAAAGLALVLTGLPPLNRPRLAQRVEPYLSGLRGRPSSLLARSHGAPAFSTLTRLSEAVADLLPSTALDLEMRLNAAGDARSIQQFRLEQFASGIAATIILWAGFLMAAASGPALDARAAPVLSLLMFAFGFLGRDWWLSRRLKRRRLTFQEELPTAIDLVTLAILSGESVPAAFARVGALLPYGIGSEFARAVADVRAGAGVAQALEDMKDRVPGPAMSRFVDALITGIERGTPLAEVLRAQAEDGREARRRYLLEVGGRREVMMLVPVVFLVMPVVVAFALYPGLVSLDLLVP